MISKEDFLNAELGAITETYYARPGDAIVVWKPDCLGRNTVKVIELVEELAKRK
jgi:hypothetical protein